MDMYISCVVIKAIVYRTCFMYPRPKLQGGEAYKHSQAHFSLCNAA